MNWIKYSERKPEISGAFLISLVEPMGDKDYRHFNCLAYYNLEADEWYTYEPFSGNTGDVINVKITAWLEGVSAFVG